MGIKKYKPTSPGVRFRTVLDYADVTVSEPLKSLTKPLKERWKKQYWRRNGLAARRG